MGNFSAELLDRPVVEAAVTVALTHLDDAATAAARFETRVRGAVMNAS